MTYAILCDNRSGHSLGIECLALVDRSKTKKMWWTSDDPELILAYRRPSAAQAQADRLQYNNPRVVEYTEAYAIIENQAEEILHNEASMDRGWDAHKLEFA